MGFIGDMFSSDKGSGFQAKGVDLGSVNLDRTALPGQWQSANQYQNRLNQYGADAYGQGQLAARQQRAFLNDLNAMGGTTNLSRTFKQAQGLADQLGAQARGEGPNPALAQLNQTTGQNVANQAALMASQRGASANPALLARQAAQQGAATQQQAVGQGAILRANQQLAAQQALQNQQQLLGQLASGQIGAQQAGVNSYNQLVGSQNAAAQGLQGQNLAQQKALADMINEYNKLNLAQQQGLNASNVAMQSNINNANAGIAAQNAQGQQGLFGGLLGGIGSIFMNKGGMAQNYADGGSVEKDNPFQNAAGMMSALDPTADIEKPKSKLAEYFSTMGTGSNSGLGGGANMLGSAIGQGMKQAFGNKGQNIPGALIDNPMKVMGSMAKLAYANKGGMPKNMKEGGAVKGKAKVSGDSIKNDTIPAMLSPKEIVVPRSITLSKNAPEKAAAFVDAILRREGMKK